jgi:hypothetical protein
MSAVYIEISNDLPDSDITDIHLVEDLPSPQTLCKNHTAKELSRMCVERGLRGRAKNKLELATRLRVATQ